MHVTVEFFGIARDLVNARELSLDLPQGSSLRDVAAALAEKCPKLVGPMIDHARTGLVAPYLFNLDGQQTVRDLDHCPRDGQRILVLFAVAGG